MFILLLFFFGVFLDIANVAIDFGFRIHFIIAVIEDGGEMLTVSFIIWYVYLLSVRGVKADYYLCDILSLLQNRNNEIITK